MTTDPNAPASTMTKREAMIAIIAAALCVASPSMAEDKVARFARVQADEIFRELNGTS